MLRSRAIAAEPAFGGGLGAFILTYRIEARKRRLTIGARPDWPVTAAGQEARRLKREIDQGRDPMAERDEARISPNVRQLIDRSLEVRAARTRLGAASGRSRGRTASAKSCARCST
jgi:hypothetical protein